MFVETRNESIGLCQEAERSLETNAERAREEMQQMRQGPSESPTVVGQRPNEGPTDSDPKDPKRPQAFQGALSSGAFRRVGSGRPRTFRREFPSAELR